jgi:hypothetical protein
VQLGVVDIASIVQKIFDPPFDTDPLDFLSGIISFLISDFSSGFIITFLDCWLLLQKLYRICSFFKMIFCFELHEVGVLPIVC